MTGLELWTKFFTLIKSITGDVDVAAKGTLQEQINDCFTSASNGKKAIAAAITGKGVSTASDAAYSTMADNIAQIKTTPTLQAKSAALSTSAQTIKPDSGYDGLSWVSVPAVTGNAGTGDVLSGKTFNSAYAGIAKTGTLADKTGTADYSATASLDATNKRIKMQVPAGGKYGTGNYLYAAYSAIASLIGLTAAKLVKGNTILGITGNSNNMDTSGGDATAAQILSGKKACVKGSLITGTMANKSGVTVDAGGVTQDDDYTYLAIPANGYYNTSSKLRAPNSDLRNNAVYGQYTIPQKYQWYDIDIGFKPDIVLFKQVGHNTYGVYYNNQISIDKYQLGVATGNSANKELGTSYNDEMSLRINDNGFGIIMDDYGYGINATYMYIACKL